MPPAKSKRRWFQYSLRSLMLLMTLAVGLLVAWRVYVEPYRRQRETMKVIERLGGRYETAQTSKWIRRLAAEEIQDLTLVDVSNYDTPLAYLEHVRRLPRLETLIVGGPNFGDEELRRLQRLGTLKWLILDSTSVSDEGIGALQVQLPELTIHRSQWRAIAALRRLGNTVLTRNVVMPQPISAAGEHCWIATEVHVSRRFDENVLTHLRAIATPFSLCLANTRLTDAQLGPLKEFPQLRSLHVGYNHITDAGLAHVAELKDLEELVLSGTIITDDGLLYVAGLANLRRLSLFGLSITDNGLERLHGLTQLTSLDLFGNHVTDDGLARLKALTSLQELDLTATRVTDAGMVHLRELTNLQELSLSATNVGDAGLLDLVRLPKLRRLSVTSAGVTWQGIRRFKQLCPACEVMDINRFRDRVSALP